MKHVFLLPAAAIVAALLASGPGTTPAPAPGGASLEKATKLLLDERSTDADRRAGLLALLDAVSEAAPSSGVPGEWPRQVARARTLLAGGATPDGEPGGLLREAYRAVNGGSAFRFPELARKPGEVVDLVRTRMQEASEALRASRPAAGVRLMLEAVLLVVTPVEA